MLEFSTYIVAQQQTSQAAHSARPESPIHSSPERRWRKAPRQRLSASLRRLADAIDPACPTMRAPALRPLS